MIEKLHKFIDSKLVDNSLSSDLVDLFFSPYYGFGVVKLEWKVFKKHHLTKR
jgi:hypothetical protein